MLQCSSFFFEVGNQLQFCQTVGGTESRGLRSTSLHAHVQDLAFETAILYDLPEMLGVNVKYHTYSFIFQKKKLVGLEHRLRNILFKL